MAQFCNSSSLTEFFLLDYSETTLKLLKKLFLRALCHYVDLFLLSEIYMICICLFILQLFKIVFSKHIHFYHKFNIFGYCDRTDWRWKHLGRTGYNFEDSLTKIPQSTCFEETVGE